MEGLFNAHTFTMLLNRCSRANNTILAFTHVKPFWQHNPMRALPALSGSQWTSLDVKWWPGTELNPDTRISSLFSKV